MATDDHRTYPAGRLAAAWFALAALACSLVGCGASATKVSAFRSKASYGTLVAAGTTLLGKGNASAAEQLFQQAIAKNPTDPVAHYNLGVIYQQMADRRNAIRQYNQALHADSRYAPALYNEAVLISDVNRPLAIFYYREVTQIQPNSPTAFLNLGLLESRTKGLHNRAAVDLERAARLDTSLRDRIAAPLRADLAGDSRGRGHSAPTGNSH